MAIDLTQSPTKELLQRSNIKTMRKDMASLREADSLAEKQKISKIKIVKEEPVKVIEKPVVKEPVAVVLPKENKEPVKVAPVNKINIIDADEQKRQEELGKILQQTPRKETKENSDNDQYVKLNPFATESEKQQIFLLQSRRANLENQIRLMNTESRPDLIAQRSKLVAEKEGLQKKLSSLSVDQQKSGQEDEQGNIEKKQWSQESEMAKLDDKIKILDEDEKQSQITENSLKEEIVDINNSLKAIYDGVAKREAAKKEVPVQAPVEKPILPKAPVVEPSSLQGKEFLKDVPVQAKEKLAESTKIEEERRLKFMEDVERWIALSNKNNQ